MLESFDPNRGAHPSWRLEEPWPATLIGMYAGEAHPEAERVLSAVANRMGDEVTVLELHPSPDEAHPWSLVARVPGLPVPVLLACERTRRMDEIRPDLVDSVAGSRWSVVIETLLDPESPSASWASMASIAADEPSLAALLDATTGRWFSPEELREDVLDPEFGPPSDVLWRIQVVSASEQLDAGTAWVFTRGLLRCGLPELELLELPGEQVRTGGELLDRLAELLVQDGAPPPEIPYAVGPMVAVSLVPWQEVVETLDSDSLGSPADRAALSQETPNPLRARRAAVCDLEPRGRFRPVWTWPREAIEALRNPDVVIRRSEAMADRAAAIARRRWPEVLACLDRRADDLVVLVGVVVAEREDGSVEHGWIQLDRADADAGEGRLLRETDEGTPAGTVRRFEVEAIDSWRVIHGDRVAAPEHPESVAGRLFPEARS